MYKYYAVLVIHNFNMLQRLSEGRVNKCTSRPRFHLYGAPITVAPPLDVHKWNKLRSDEWVSKKTCNEFLAKSLYSFV